MSGFCEDSRQLETYPNGIIGKPRAHGVPLIECLQWSETKRGISRFETVQDFTNASPTTENAIRVAFLPIAPVEGDTNETLGYRSLFQHYSIPSAVPAERMRNVGMSFGTTRNQKDKSEGAWFHFLCRRVAIRDAKIQDLEYLRHGNRDGLRPDPTKLWAMADFYLHVSPATTQVCDRRTVTLLGFGAPDEVQKRFRYLLDRDQEAWRDVLSEPYLLFDILFDELHGVFDNAVWELSKAVNPQEKMALERADLSDESSFNFQILHNIQKNAAFMIEAAGSSISTLQAMIMELDRKVCPTNLTTTAARSLEYRERSFLSTLSRLQTLDRRMSNVIQLSSSVITYLDGRVMIADSATLKADSRAMKLIAFLTLVFLPATSVASIFSTPFFDVDWQASGTSVLTTAKDFWIFWAVAVPLTLTGLLLYFAWVNLWRFDRSRGMTIGRQNSRAFGESDLEAGKTW